MAETQKQLPMNAILSPGWVRPSDVMKNRKLKARRRALQARMNTSLPLQVLLMVDGDKGCTLSSAKRENPFKCSTRKVHKLDGHDTDSSENSADGILFQLLHSKQKIIKQDSPYNISTVLNETSAITPCRVEPMEKWSDTLYSDWSLKSKVRFLSSNPLPWKSIFKTSEEASGTTGFVRCLKSEMTTIHLDTSSNAQFYECCLVWQHPAIPMVPLFPRDKQKISSHMGIYGTDSKIASELHNEWSESLRSLYQLLRVRQCPYFYVCTHSFTCLFRAAGVGGVSNIHALISPTTAGFREALRKEDIVFTMPLLSNKENTSREIPEEGEADVEDSEDDNTESERQESSSFLEDLGLETSQFPTLNHSRVKESKNYRGMESLIFIEDVELQGLINFLLNCSSCTISVGALAGVPPTLLSPVAFQGGTLKSLKVNSSQIRNSNGEIQYSLDIRGPVLPATVLQLASLLASSIESFTISLSTVASTLPFSSFVPVSITSTVPMAFASEGLLDCGLGKSIRSIICRPPSSAIDDLPSTYTEIVYKDDRFTWK